ncbi:unnamed protein product [Notodromas monacha]|uniref:C2H2-type domain-containing protein n=1 Tax=Notodromas monacha TaxID=399045 RepID=A0A7R9BM90_9CRUS|nr:unnamed protein product [Notodromas monacha]CAG0918105.1 unnamed protein product [Notodromas monacha]
MVERTVRWDVANGRKSRSDRESNVFLCRRYLTLVSFSFCVFVKNKKGEKPYECGTCGRRFAVSNHLRYHERAHTGEKPFRCSVCAKGFTSNFNLKYHEQIHAGIKPHSCDFCGKKYRSKAGLTGHQMKKGHHERFQSMMRDGYFLDGHGPSFSNGEMKSDQDPSASSAPSPASAGEGPSGLQSQVWWESDAEETRPGTTADADVCHPSNEHVWASEPEKRRTNEQQQQQQQLNPELPPSSSSSSSSSSVVPGRGPPLSRGPPMDMFGPVNLKNDGLLNEVHHLHNAPGLQPTPQPPPASSTPASTSSSSSSSEIVSRSNGDNVGGKEDDDIGVGGGGGGGPGGIGGVGGYMPSPSPMYPMMNIRSAAPMFAPPPQPGFLSYPAQQAYQVQFEQQQRFFMGRSPVPSPGHLGGGHHHPLTHHPLHHHHQPPLHQHHQLQYADRKPDEPQ